MRFLVVDDQASIRMLVAAALKEHDGRSVVEFAGNGMVALQRLAEASFDCVVSDWYMPEMDGLELLRSIRQDPRLSALSVVLLTSEGGREQVVEAIESGVTDYLCKPFKVDALVQKVMRAARLKPAPPVAE